MNKKYYRKKIAIIVVLFTFIPVLLFAGIFYRQVYNNRVQYHLAENEKFMTNKATIIERELIQYITIVRNIATHIETPDKEVNIDRQEMLDSILKKNMEFLSLKIIDGLPSEFAYEGDQMDFRFGSNKQLILTYPLDVSREIKEYLIAEISIERSVNWFTEFAPNTYIAMVNRERIIYASDEIKDVTLALLGSVSEDISLSKLTDNKEDFYGLKYSIPEEGISFYVFKKDNMIEVFRAFYIDYILKIVLMLLLSSVVTYVISLQLNYPFNAIKKAAKAIIDGEYDARIDNVEDELLNLNLSFNKMALIHQEKNEEFVDYAMVMLEKNEHLTELNQQLEASYDQLKAVTEMLEYSKDKYQALFDHIKEFVWVFDNDGLFTYVNKIMCVKLGYTEEELIGIHISTVILRFEEEELFHNGYIDQLLRRDYGNLSAWLKTKSGEEILVSANSKRAFKNGILQGAQGTARTVEFEEMLQNRVLRKNREFEIVKEITWSLANNQNMDSLLMKVGQKVEELFMPELCTIRTVEKDQLVYKAGIGKLASSARTDRFSIHDDFSGIAIKENRILRVKDFENTIFYNKASLETLLGNIEEIVVIPLENKGTIHGTINIGVLEPLKDVDIKLLKSLANQASIGIEKVKLYDRLKEEYLNTIRVLASAVEAKDKYTEGHSVRVSLLARRIGQQLKLDEEVVEELEIAGMLHDIGKIGIDDEIITKKGALTDSEYAIMKTHPTVGKKILEPIGLPDNIMRGILMHHKRHDLKGYPEDVTVSSLSLYPAVIGVADAFDAMTSNRTYSDEKSLKVAMEELKKYKGKQFAPIIVDAIEAIIKEDEASIIAIMK